ncbi:MAG: hypothetical protein JKY19_06795 [Alcanivoracaceae bacterium]|nr:hypothetical protein [Alcanivoracaceae bacterium]
MQESGFFKWVIRINSLLFLLFLMLGIGVSLYGFHLINRVTSSSNEVVISQSGSSQTDEEVKESFLLEDITTVSGNDVQYLMLNAKTTKRGYRKDIRNVVFFEGEQMKSHWLFENNDNKFEVMQQLKRPIDDSDDQMTVAIYYQLRNEDTDNNGKIDKNDILKIALTSPNGHDYTEIEKGMTSILEHSIDEDALVLTLLTQFEESLVMKKYSLQTKKKISEREITRIGKKF